MKNIVYGVVAYEMSNSWPPEALKAQAVAARCYAYKRLEDSRNGISDIGDTSGDQVYKGTLKVNENIINAVKGTDRKVS